MGGQEKRLFFDLRTFLGSGLLGETTICIFKRVPRSTVLTPGMKAGPYGIAIYFVDVLLSKISACNDGLSISDYREAPVNNTGFGT